MANKWVGYHVSVNCGEPLGFYQGTILNADGATITLTKAFRNGFPYPKPQVTLNASDIKELKIVEQPPVDNNEIKKTSTVSVLTKPKKLNRSSVSENIRNNSMSPQNINGGGGNQNRAYNNNNNKNNSTQTLQQQQQQHQQQHQHGPSRSKPIDIQQRPNRNQFGGSSGNSGTTPNKKEKQRKRNEACFGTPSDDPIMSEEFDFEKNLALFDKQALWEELKHSKPDLVRQTDNARSSNQKYRHDENIIDSAPTVFRIISVPDRVKGNIEYVTDEGLVVPSIMGHMKKTIWSSIVENGIEDFSSTMFARAAANLSLRLLGGDRRLDPRNAHQVPVVVILTGPHRVGVTGINTAQILASHGVRTVVLVWGPDHHRYLRIALNHYKMTNNKIAGDVDDLPSADLILVALTDDSKPDMEYRRLADWISHGRAQVVFLDPPAHGIGEIQAKISLTSVLPMSYTPENGKLYLCNLGIPQQIFTELGIRYKSPFGAKDLVALHPNED